MRAQLFPPTSEPRPFHVAHEKTSDFLCKTLKSPHTVLGRWRPPAACPTAVHPLEAQPACTRLCGKRLSGIITSPGCLGRWGVPRHRKAGARTRVGKSNQLNSVDQSLIYPTIPFLFLIIPCFLQIFLDFFQLHFLTALWGQNSVFLQAKWLHSDFIECRSTFLQMGPKSSYYEVKVTSLNAVQLVANGAKRQS